MSNSNQQQQFNTKCFYGESGSGKSREVAATALYVYEKHHKKTRLYSTDGGGWGVMQAHIDAGIIEPVNLSADPDPLLRVVEASKGYWPDSSGTWQPPEKQKDWADVGMIAVEGLSSMAELILADTVAEGRKIAQDVVGKFQILDPVTGEKFSFGNPSEAHYGFAQRQISDRIRDFQGLLSKGVKEIIYTALESKGEDKLTKAVVLGPMVIGKALTAVIPHRVGDLIHLDVVQNEKKEIEYRAYFKNHLDREIQRSWPCKLRLGPEESKAIAQHPELKLGYILLTDEDGVLRKGITKLFRWRDNLKDEAVGKLRKFMEENKEKQAKELEALEVKETPKESPVGGLGVATPALAPPTPPSTPPSTPRLTSTLNLKK